MSDTDQDVLTSGCSCEKHNVPLGEDLEDDNPVHFIIIYFFLLSNFKLSKPDGKNQKIILISRSMPVAHDKMSLISPPTGFKKGSTLNSVLNVPSRDNDYHNIALSL